MRPMTVAITRVKALFSQPFIETIHLFFAKVLLSTETVKVNLEFVGVTEGDESTALLHANHVVSSVAPWANLVAHASCKIDGLFKKSSSLRSFPCSQR